MHLGSSWSLSSPSDLQHRVQPIIDVHAVCDAMQKIVRLSDIEQLCENDVLTFPSSSFSQLAAASRHRTRDVISSISLLASSASSAAHAPSVAAPPDDVSSSLRSTSLYRLRLAVLALASQHNFAQDHCGLFCCSLRRLQRNLLHDVLVLSHSSLTQRRNLCTCREH